MPDNSIVAFLGAGAMGQALIRGLITGADYNPLQIVAADIDSAALSTLKKETGVRTTTSNRRAVRNASVVVLSVKPNIVPAVLSEVGGALDPSQLLVSIAAGVCISRIESLVREGVPVIRVMPNTPCLVGQSASGFAAGTHATDRHLAITAALLKAVGIAVEVDEKLLDAVTGLSGSGPAYVYLFIEALSDAGVRMGLPRSVAAQLAAQTVKGASEMVLTTGRHPGALKDMVTSPGGTTIAGIYELERGKFRATVMNAVKAATERSVELGQYE
ncbi:MAG: pyrroline-5-carboxylate reductase [Armatimonadetes bacterium CG2_30_59_28]|nr:pyrroline-5-carboxylate reductase [Armatimonadota bacterium]OIO89912.1 MAG: pyrroline-5-carboxylate reductase [Armatimonadetes bacterium CG2_30_59_28]PIU60469.1 MAG: pyrroline-5-carboxylate reductase [Armatimonadetes bacterium CG07_land_8_20_14_0_80_59_28]PIX43282.1 MAG: pyrroline-5-carboxylate reductase [Armatimonadetes bacterium CG_4_8_14_3_um_filter_58_9]PIY47449.1 MAG: pyrroline-5-carboxylate reductase [Armatimonadetes bacterium CG_4_10_14_3_um_filter_59_10]PJB70301.1 MAG: pyrroline-5-c